jgi:hypothetical protein
MLVVAIPFYDFALAAKINNNITYMMGALQRHEAEKFCVDNKKTFLGCNLDGDSAFEVVNRAIHTRELYCAGERGQYWLTSNY